MYSYTFNPRSRSSTKGKEPTQLSKIKNFSKPSNNSSASHKDRSKYILHKYFADPTHKTEHPHDIGQISEKLKERKMKLEQELGDYLGIEFESEQVNQKKAQISNPSESRAFREFRQIRQSMASESRRNK